MSYDEIKIIWEEITWTCTICTWRVLCCCGRSKLMWKSMSLKKWSQLSWFLIQLEGCVEFVTRVQWFTWDWFRGLYVQESTCVSKCFTGQYDWVLVHYCLYRSFFCWANNFFILMRMSLNWRLWRTNCSSYCWKSYCFARYCLGMSVMRMGFVWLSLCSIGLASVSC